MRGADRKARRLVAAVVVAALLVNFPVLAVVEAAAEAADVPFVPVWLVLVWAGLIATVAKLAGAPAARSAAGQPEG